MAVTSSTIVSGSINESHWNSLNVLFFTSGSPTLTNIINPPSGSDQFDLPHSNFAVMLNGAPVDVNLSLADAGLTDGCQIDLVPLE